MATLDMVQVEIARAELAEARRSGDRRKVKAALAKLDDAVRR